MTIFLLIGDGEVELPFLHIGACHLDADGVAQLVFMVTAAAHQTVVLLVELVVVVVQVVHGYHALAVVLVYLAVDAIALNARDVGIVFLADLVAHELHHLILDGVALGALCSMSLECSQSSS